MGIFDFLKQKKISDRYAISLDIGTEFVKSLIFKVVDDKAEVIGVGRQRQKLTDMQGGMVTDIGGVIKNCEASLEMAANQAGLLPDQVIIGIAGELVKGTTTTIKYSRSHPKNKISIQELKDIIARVQRRAFDRARSILAWESGYSEIDVRLVNAAIVDVKIDGYKVINPLGFQGKEIQIGVFNAFAPIVHLGALQTIAESLSLDLLSITAEPYAVARCMGPEEGAEFSAIFIDIGGGTTDIAVVNRGGVIGTKMFALGGRAFTKRVSQAMGVSFPQAEELKIKYAQGKLESTQKVSAIKKALETDCDVWASGVELSLGEFKNIDLLPSKILLCGGGSALPDLLDAIKDHKWSKKLPFARRPVVQYIDPKDITNVIDKTGELKHTWDVTPMSLANLAIDLVGEEKVVDGVLSKVVEGLRL
ncbi:MAG: Actin-like ATPase involved in cell division-like protein [uncultured bacterium]|nr:MAG: Actin-like ATPase involved in cell division-like protein [uncultured bacterium]